MATADLKQRSTDGTQLLCDGKTPGAAFVQPYPPGTVLFADPVVYGNFIHAWNFNPLAGKRGAKEPCRQLGIWDALGPDDECHVWRARKKLIKEVLQLRNVCLLAPHVVESIDEDVEPLAFFSEVAPAGLDPVTQLTCVF